MKVLIDTCIIIDALQCREPFFDDAQDILIGNANDEFTGIITAKSVLDIYYIIHRYNHNNDKTKGIILNLLSLLTVCDTTKEDINNAILSDISDYEDAVIAAAAERIHADAIVTRNSKDYRKSTVRVMEPYELLNELDLQSHYQDR